MKGERADKKKKKASFVALKSQPVSFNSSSHCVGGWDPDSPPGERQPPGGAPTEPGPRDGARGALCLSQRSLYGTLLGPRAWGSGGHVTGSGFTAGAHVIPACSRVAAVKYLGA